MSEERPVYEPAKVPDARPGPEGGKRHQNRLRKTRALVEAARSHFLERGLEPVTIDDIVRTAGVSKGSFYRYFENKEALIAALFQPLTEPVIAALDTAATHLASAREPAAFEAAYAELAGELLPVLLGQTEALQIFLQERHGAATPAREPVHALDAAVIDRALRMTRAAQTSGFLKPLEPEVSAIAVIGAIHELLRRFLAGEGLEDPVRGAEQLVDLVLHGVRRVPEDA